MRGVDEQRDVSAGRLLVLVVEDDPEMNELERQFLAASGIDAVGAYSGPEAVQAAEADGFDAVLLDLMLPGMDGFETCRRLRRRSDAPILILSALDSDDCRQRGLAAGASAYFTKPFDPYEVVARLRDLTSGNGALGGGA